jgi:hypothetical protein
VKRAGPGWPSTVIERRAADLRAGLARPCIGSLPTAQGDRR